ncbi:protein-L-isoaspartate(D-aspartate) O-methyltransferase [Fodinibius halophilus]|uniref:Protein-L-isoaspartate O-methyltransferase n=1 Tax=Fodinibius halophilus TaxID=1736908 RepID=A0A6M1T049_9BACT|nr:protein-L-isoaspartate(D-aspartate) O-methyltransferase [Fodinibius halophilus]NGP89488.1 protein-L-isoaspartate(D-aspartate) O-methyltransferase [Fodinibius halophilus]
MVNWGSGANNPKFKRRRERLVETLADKGIEDPRVLEAFSIVPRHIFVDTALQDRAYKDTALPIGKEQTISQPFTVASQTELLEVKPGEKVLEIGTGSGYQASILCELGAEVYTVERHKKLYEKARSTLKELGYSVRAKLGDGTLGWSAYAPYDAIVVTAGAPVVPDDLVEQLAINGRLVVPVGDEKRQEMIRIIKIRKDEYEEEHYSDFKFVPLIGKKGWQK